MGRRRKFGRPLDGVLILDKQAGVSSNGALQEAKRLFFAQKAGHTGALDPLATGVLPICFGEATKFSQWLLDSDKRYRARIQLGITTSTGDLEGDIVQTNDTSALTEERIREVVSSFVGEGTQVPSMYSAIKHKGKPLYEFARKGVQIEREARQIHLHKLDVLEIELNDEAYVDIDVICSKGTYIRTLAEDIGTALGVGAHISRLHRSAAGRFSDQGAISLEQLRMNRGDDQAEVLDSELLPIDVLLEQFERIDLDERSVEFFILGQAVMVPGVYRFAKETDIVRTFCETGRFLGIGEVTGEGGVRPRRLLAQS